MLEFVRDDDAHPWIVDLGRGDQREERADVGVGLAAHVLPGPGSQGVAKVGLPRVDEEVDRLGLGHAEELAGGLDGRFADPECPLPECRVAVIPVDAHEIAGSGPPLEPIVLEEEPGGRTLHAVHSPAVVQRRVGQQVGAAADGQRIRQDLGATIGRRLDRVDRGAERVGERDQEFDGPRRRAQGDRLGELHGLPERAHGGAGAERDLVDRGDGGGRQPAREQTEGQRETETAAGSHSAHASPAIRMIPIPFWPAPSSSSLASAHPSPPYAIGTTGASTRRIDSARS